MTDTVVLIPHYNNIDGLQKTLSSISDMFPVDVLIVDDGSESVPDQMKLSKMFPDIHALSVITLPQNYGIEHALNKGLQYIKQLQYKYIARLDSGDCCKADRFLKQRIFLEQNPEVCLVGSGVRFMDTEGKYLYSVNYPTTAGEIRVKMYLNNMFCHSSVMFRREIVDCVGMYPIDYHSAEDYAFFFNIVERYSAANIPEILQYCEMNPQGISQCKRKTQLRSRIKIILAHWRWQFPAVYGLLRNIAIYLAPDWLVFQLKKMNNGMKY